MGDTLKRKGCDTMHVLVVEDDYLLNNTLCYNLNAAGYKVDCGVLPVKRTMKNNKFFSVSLLTGWRYFYAAFNVSS